MHLHFHFVFVPPKLGFVWFIHQKHFNGKYFPLNRGWFGRNTLVMIFIFGCSSISIYPGEFIWRSLAIGVSGPTQGHLLETRYPAPGPSASSPLVHVGQDTFGGLVKEVIIVKEVACGDVWSVNFKSLFWAQVSVGEELIGLKLIGAIASSKLCKLFLLHTSLYLCNICLDVFVFPPSWICVIYSWKARPWQGSIYLLPNQEITTPDVSLKCLRQPDLLLSGEKYKRK